MKSAEVKKRILIGIGLIIFLSLASSIQANSWPWGQTVKSFNGRFEPLVNRNLDYALPIGLGPIAEGGDILEIGISLDTANIPIDVYLGFSAPFDQNRIYLLTNSGIQPLSSGLIPFKKNVSGNITLNPLGKISTKNFITGEYKLYLLIAPTGKPLTESGYRLWITSFNVSNNHLKEYKWNLWHETTKLRGANIYQRRVYKELDDDLLGPGPIGPPYTQQDFDELARLGANYVNISHPGIFTETPPYQPDNAMKQNLDKLIQMAAKADLFVVIAFRTGPGRNEFSILREGAGNWFPSHYLNEKVWKDISAQNGWVSMWQHAAQHYKDDPVVIGYDLMVEPNSNDILGVDDPAQFDLRYANSTYDWNMLYPKIAKAIREIDHYTPILIQANGYSSMEWHYWLKPPVQSKTVISIHQYEPFEYTHQECKLSCFSYPSSLDLDWDGEPDNFNNTWLETFINNINLIRTRTGAPVAITEFGAMRWVPGAAQFLFDEMGYFEQLGVNHAIWLWESSWEPYIKEESSFNFKFGTNSNTKHYVNNNKLINTIKTYWLKNKRRPSMYIKN